jgi:hypothetical protein
MPDITLIIQSVSQGVASVELNERVIKVQFD